MGRVTQAFVVVAALGLGALGAYLVQQVRAPASEPTGFQVVVSIPPLAGLLEPMLPEDADVRIVVPPGVSVHGFELRPSDLAAIARADVVAVVGLGIDGRVEAAARGVEPPPITLVMSELANVRGGDAHLWLDPAIARAFVQAAGARIAYRMTVDGDRAASGRVLEAMRALDAEIAAIDEAYATRLAPAQGAPIVTHHAAWTRLASRYGLRQAAVVRPIEDAEPTPAEIADAVRAIEAEGVSVMFVEPQFSDAGARRLAEVSGVRVGQLDPLGSGDWLGMMRANLAELERLLVAEAAGEGVR